jgi:hypothetical protein
VQLKVGLDRSNWGSAIFPRPPSSCGYAAVPGIYAELAKGRVDAFDHPLYSSYLCCLKSPSRAPTFSPGSNSPDRCSVAGAIPQIWIRVGLFMSGLRLFPGTEIAVPAADSRPRFPVALA